MVYKEGSDPEGVYLIREGDIKVWFKNKDIVGFVKFIPLFVVIIALLRYIASL